MEEQWIKWEPISGLKGNYNINLVLNDPKTFKIILSDYDNPKSQVIITFEESVASYRDTDETYRYKLICDLGEKYGKEFYINWGLFKVKNSNYIKWLSEQSYGISDHFECNHHFAILGVNCVLDIIASYEPKVEMINE